MTQRLLPLRRFAAGLALIALLAACASTPRPAAPMPPHEALADFALQGRFSLRHEETSYSGRITWRHAGDSDHLLLASPFGQGMAEIVAKPGAARLTAQDGREFSAPDVESLTREVLGYALPLADLIDWVRGRDSPAVEARDAQGRPTRLRQNGWRIDYGYADDNPHALPATFFADRPDGLDLRLRIDEWSEP